MRKLPLCAACYNLPAEATIGDTRDILPLNGFF
jgi:hypothetical protein